MITSQGFGMGALVNFEFKEGGKYYKVIKEQGEYNKHVWFFVSKEDGLIWKPASWKSPAKNFPRGNILEDKAKDVIGVYGI